ncbi:MAG: M16 family metallopeptidase [Myxococcota bacterium]
MLRSSLCAALLLTLWGCATEPWTGASGPTREEDWVRTTLQNGLEVMLLEDHSAPVVALNVWVHVGSADERPSEAGMAHVFEHMLFKGTERRAVGEIARTVEAAGGNINAFTSFDMTVYHITMSSRDTAVGVDVLSDAVLHSSFDPDELRKEKQVILEEIRRGEDSPGQVLSKALFAEAFRAHPYRRPVIGTPDSVVSFTREQLLDFHRRWYVPNNMTFVVVGDFDPRSVLSQIRAAFEAREPRPDVSHSRAAEPEPQQPAGEVVRRDFEQTQMGLAFLGTSIRDADTPYLDLLGMVLGGGETSRLYRDLKDRRRLVHSVSAGAYTPFDPGLFMIDVTLEPEKIDETLPAIREEITKLAQLGPSQVELDRARTNLLSSQVHEKETMEGQARKIGYWETLGGGIEAEQRYLDAVRRATRDDLQHVASRYLQAQHVRIVALLPARARADLDGSALVRAFEQGAHEARAPAPETLEDGVLRYRLANGLRVIVKRNASVPLVSMRLAFHGGLLVENEATQGISSFLAHMLEKGTEQRSASELASEIEDIAGSTQGFSGRNSFGLTAEFLADSLDAGLDLFTDVLLHPTFPDDEIEKLRSETVAAIERREDNLARKAFDLFDEALYPRHPYRFPTLGTIETVERFDRAALRDYWKRWATPHNGVLAIVGDVDPQAVVKALSIYLGDWTGPAEIKLPVRAVPSPPREPRERVIEKGRQQVHLVYGFRGLSVDDPDVPALDVLANVLGGQGGRLFLELRDRRSLAYTVTAFDIEGVDPGSFAVYIASAPEKLDAARVGIQEQLRRIVDQPIDPEELARAKGYLVGSDAVSLQRYGSQASLLSLDELYGLGATHHLGFRSRIEAVTLADVKRVARRVLHLDAPVIAVIR